MPAPYLVYNGSIINNLEELKLEAFDDSYLGNKKVTKGQWYYEFKHLIDKNHSNRISTGFNSESGGISLSYYSNENQFSIYTPNKNVIYVTNGSNSIATGLYYEEQINVGVGIDIDNRYFYVRYGNNIKIFNFTCLQSCKHWSFVTRETKTPGAYDYISLYLANNLQYKPPFNAIPWGRNIPIISCINKKYQNNLFYFIEMIII